MHTNTEKMNKTVIHIFSILFGLSIFETLGAQEVLPFIEEGKVWTYKDKYKTITFSFGGDTIIDEQTFTKVIKKENELSTYFGACREIGGEVFMRFPQKEKDELLYDFSFPERMIYDRENEKCRSEIDGEYMVNGINRRLFNIYETWKSYVEYPDDYERGEDDPDYVWRASMCPGSAIEGIGSAGMPFIYCSSCDDKTFLTVTVNGKEIYNGNLFETYFFETTSINTRKFFTTFIQDYKCWYVAEQNIGGKRKFVKYVIQGDTIINSKNYKKLYRNELGASQEDTYYAALFEEQGKLYRIDAGEASDKWYKVLDLNQAVSCERFSLYFKDYEKLIPDSYVEENEMQQDNSRVFRQQVIRKNCENGYVGREYVREGVGALHFPFLPMIASSDEEEAVLPVLLLCEGADGTVYYEADHNSELWKQLVATGIDIQTSPKKSDRTYDLQGRQVKQKEKGLYIQNGKKVLQVN